MRTGSCTTKPGNSDRRDQSSREMQHWKLEKLVFNQWTVRQCAEACRILHHWDHPPMLWRTIHRPTTWMCLTVSARAPQQLWLRHQTAICISCHPLITNHRACTQNLSRGVCQRFQRQEIRKPPGSYCADSLPSESLYRSSSCGSSTDHGN